MINVEYSGDASSDGFDMNEDMDMVSNSLKEEETSEKKENDEASTESLITPSTDISRKREHNENTSESIPSKKKQKLAELKVFILLLIII